MNGPDSFMTLLLPKTPPFHESQAELAIRVSLPPAGYDLKRATIADFGARQHLLSADPCVTSSIFAPFNEISTYTDSIFVLFSHILSFFSFFRREY